MELRHKRVAQKNVIINCLFMKTINVTSQQINFTQNTFQKVTHIILFWERKALHLHLNLNESILNVLN